MKSKGPANAAIGMVCGFFVLVLVIAFITNPHYPVSVIAGEASVGTWLSGAMLVSAATLSLVAGMRRGGGIWGVVAAFFALLALDERFMFHENVKERIILFFPAAPPSLRWISELPLLIGACIGFAVAYLLWRRFRRSSRLLLVCAVVFGCASVTLDVFHAGVFWEDGFKLLAELPLVCALLGEIDESHSERL